jgi:hypothetical protein
MHTLQYKPGKSNIVRQPKYNIVNIALTGTNITLIMHSDPRLEITFEMVEEVIVVVLPNRGKAMNFIVMLMSNFL